MATLANVGGTWKVVKDKKKLKLPPFIKKTEKPADISPDEGYVDPIHNSFSSGYMSDNEKAEKGTTNSTYSHNRNNNNNNSNSNNSSNNRSSNNTNKNDEETGTQDTIPALKLPEAGSESKNVKLAKHNDGGVVYNDYPILKYIQDNTIGQDLVIFAPYGPRRVVYCDYTASGRCLAFVEDYIRDQVIPTYANTHSTTGHNARQTGKFREEARSIIKKSVNAGKDDVVIFTGSGATSGIHKIAWALKITQHRVAEETVVLTGPYEHHSNILPWREYGTKVVRIQHVPSTGMVDLTQLQDELKFWRERKRHMLVCMSAASNVTGIITDTDAVASLAHKYGALTLFDYAGGGPYLNIDMNASKTAYKDAVIVSPHKFAGGPGTPGLVIAKKWIFKNAVPDRVGGGTVTFVTRKVHGYVGNIEEREEGGTPAIIESIRAGLVFQLKEKVGTDLISARDEELCRRAFDVWERNPCMHVLGNHTSSRVPIFSFLTLHPQTGRLIHHNFISTLLSDLFGIQARGGCACAGPYAEDLMGITEITAKSYYWFFSETQTSTGSNPPPVQLAIMKPGFTRLNLSYFNDDKTTDFIIRAVDMVTKNGWKLLPDYTFDAESGSWWNTSFSQSKHSHLNSLKDAHLWDPDRIGMIKRHHGDEALTGPSYKDVLTAAEKLFRDAETQSGKPRIETASIALHEQIPAKKRRLRWFLTPQEARSVLDSKGRSQTGRHLYRAPFRLPPQTYRSLHDDDGYHSDSLSTSRSAQPVRRRMFKSLDRSQKDRHA